MFRSLMFKHNLYEHEGKITAREQSALAYIATGSWNLQHENVKVAAIQG